MPEQSSIVISLALNAEGGGAPEWVELIPAPDHEGWVRGRDGRKWRMSEPQGVLDHFAATGRDLVLDWEHSSELKAPKGEEAPAAGWIVELRIRRTRSGPSIEGRVEWTEAGRRSVESKEYRYLSPVLLYLKNTLEIIGLTSAGLTNQQNLFNRALNAEGPTRTNNNIMNEEQMKELCRALGLLESSTAAEILSGANRLQSAKTQAETDLEKARNRAESPSLEKFVPRGDYDAATARATNAEQALADFQKTQRDGEIATAINAALKAGKITPATKDYHVAQCQQEGGLERFQQFVEHAPVIGDPAKFEGAQPDGADKALNAEETAVAAMMGVDPEDLKKTKASA